MKELQAIRETLADNELVERIDALADSVKEFTDMVNGMTEYLGLYMEKMNAE